MRRSDREITDFNEIVEVIKKCDVCRLAINNGEYPYIVPLNFGFNVENGVITLYFHSAPEGTKLKLIKNNANVSFEMDCGHQLVCTVKEDGCSCTMNYESVVGRGKAELLPDEEKLWALKVLMSHYHEEEFPLNEKAAVRTAAFKVTVSEVSGKRRI